MRNTSIPFHVPYLSGNEDQYLKDAIERRTFSGNGHYTKRCERELQRLTSAPRVLLTSSCTHALEMCALLLDIQPGDEVIMSSFNFVSAANAFVLRGASIVFVDVDPLTMNLDPAGLPAAITKKTKAILAMHYGGVACDMEAIMKIAGEHGVKVIEDAAHCIDAYWQGRHLGAIGDLGALSFHATKNIHCGEGGALLINNQEYEQVAEIIREKGTNRMAFQNGLVDKYTWVGLGSSYLMSELSAAFLYGQLLHLSVVTSQRKRIHRAYTQGLEEMAALTISSADKESNAHVFYLNSANAELIAEITNTLREKNIQTAFHYPPLHRSSQGFKSCRFSGNDEYTTQLSSSLIRLPIYHSLSLESVNKIVKTINDVVKEIA